MLYEGTNEIQANDLLVRKVMVDGRSALLETLAEIAAELDGSANSMEFRSNAAALTQLTNLTNLTFETLQTCTSFTFGVASDSSALSQFCCCSGRGRASINLATATRTGRMRAGDLSLKRSGAGSYPSSATASA